jgi:hypothetical protein
MFFSYAAFSVVYDRDWRVLVFDMAKVFQKLKNV